MILLIHKIPSNEWQKPYRIIGLNSEHKQNIDGTSWVEFRLKHFDNEYFVLIHQLIQSNSFISTKRSFDRLLFKRQTNFF